MLTTMPDPSQAVPRRIGPYRVTRFLGRGATGRVYACATDKGEAVAVKVGHAGEAGLLNTEYAALKYLSQRRVPGVVRVLETGHEDAAAWYSMDLVEGPTLRSLWARVWRRVSSSAAEPTRQISATDAGVSWTPTQPREEIGPREQQLAEPPDVDAVTGLLNVALQIAETLGHLHASGVAHGDLKPENIVLRESGEPVLVDFGAVGDGYGGELRESTPLKATPWMTPGYAAPEVMRGEPSSARSDLFSFGCLLFELLTGRLPSAGFGGEHHVDGELPWPASTSALATGDLRSLVVRLLAEDPAERPGFAQDVVELLGQRLAPAGRRSPRDLPSLATALHRPRWVGRTEEMARLTAALAAISKQPGVFVIEGEDGIGKTRLLSEALGRIDSGAVRLVAASPQGIVGSTEGSTGLVGPLTRALGEEATRRDAPAFVEALLSRQESEAPGSGAFGSVERAVNELVRALAWLSESRATVLVLDDAEAADDLTLELVLTLQRRPVSTVWVVATWSLDATDSRLSALKAGASHSVVLGRLSEDETRQLLRDVLATLRVAPALVTQVFELSAGNPLFALEYARAAVDQGLIHRRGGAWEMANAESSAQALVSLPATTRGLLRLRCARLSAGTLRLLELAALLGDRGQIPRLVELGRETLGYDDTAAATALGELLGSGLVKRIETSEYELDHPLLREYVESTLSQADRLRLHGSVADHLIRSQASGERFEGLDEALGLNLAEAGRDREAFEPLALAAARHAAQFNLRRAVHLYQRALLGFAGLDEFPSDRGGSRTATQAALDAGERLADARAQLGRFDEAAATYDRLLSTIGEPLRRARVWRKRGYTLTSQHLHEDAARAYRAALEQLPADPGADREQARERIEIGLCHIENTYFQQDTEGLRQMLEQWGPMVQKLGDASQVGRFALYAANALFLSAGFSYTRQAGEYWLQAIDVLEAAPEVALARVDLGMALLFAGPDEWAHSAHHLRQGLEDADRIDDAKLLARAKAYLSTASRRLRRVDEAAHEARGAIDAAEACGVEMYVAVGWANLAWAAFMKDDLEQTLKLGERALTTWRGLGVVYPMQWLAAFPMLAVLVGSDGPNVRPLVELLLAPNQQRLPDELRSALLAWTDAETIAARSDAARATLRMASSLGYL